MGRADHSGRAPTALVGTDGRLTDEAIAVLQAVSGVRMELLKAARVRRSRDNWLHAPWYPYARGGAITLGRSIYFTRIYFSGSGYGNDHASSVRRWLLLLAHEVGHLEHADRYTQSTMGRMRYVLTFTWQYAMQAVRPGRHAHDDAALEIEADMGRWVLLHLPVGSLDRIVSDLVQARPLNALLTTLQAQAPALRERYRREQGITAAPAPRDRRWPQENP